MRIYSVQLGHLQQPTGQSNPAEVVGVLQ